MLPDSPLVKTVLITAQYDTYSSEKAMEAIQFHNAVFLALVFNSLLDCWSLSAW